MNFFRITLSQTTSTLLILFALGCAGGSGSSGFDLSESLIVQRVADTQECEEINGLLICPAGESTPLASSTPTEAPHTPTATTGESDETATPLPPRATASPTDNMHTPNGTPTPPGVVPTPTLLGTPQPTEVDFATKTATRAPTNTASPTVPATATTSNTATMTTTATATTIPGIRIETNVPLEDGPSLCMLSDRRGICDVDFAFFASGFPEDAAFRVATREIGTMVAWHILPPTVADPIEPDSFATRIPLPEENFDITEETSIQVVILVFESDPGPVPDRVRNLSDTGATLAFVAEPLPVVAP